MLYRAVSEVNDGKVSTSIEEWHVRNIRARRNSRTVGGTNLEQHGYKAPKVVNISPKHEGTWGKLSSKTGDYGWLPNLWAGFKQQFRVGADLPWGIYTTKLAALKFELANQLEEADYLTSELASETDAAELAFIRDQLGEVNAIIAALKRRIKALP